VGEGTGRPADLDAFDRYYLHLVLWDEAAGQIAGAYRMGLADEILADGGVGALYTSTLFKFRRGMFDRLGPAIELGRSFVSEEYQRGYLPLLLLWHGIGAYVAEHPKYRYVFGAVSISNDFKPVTRRLIVRCLERARGDPALARQVRPRRPLKARRGERLPEPPGGLPADVPALDALVGEMEEGRNLPVLLRQYLKMGARILAFNVDPDFNCALDALVLVDLPATEPALLARHLGRDAARRILARR
jgi:putative hemolysin